MTSRKNIKIFDFNGVNLPSTGMWRGEVFAISDCLVRFDKRQLVGLIYVNEGFYPLSRSVNMKVYCTVYLLCGCTN